MNCRSRVNDPPNLTPKQPKVATFDKTDFWGLKYPLEVWVEHKTCITICGTPVPAILNHKKSTGSAGGSREGPLPKCHTVTKVTFLNGILLSKIHFRLKFIQNYFFHKLIAISRYGKNLIPMPKAISPEY